MRASLALTIILYAFGLTAWTVVQVFRPRARIELSTAALVVLESGLLLQAAVELFYLMGGHRPAAWRRMSRTWSRPSLCSPSWCPSAERGGRPRP
jgi:hypothetical protein